MNTYEVEKQMVIEWLEHPSELGKAPAKIEYANEFVDEDGEKCIIFKYKKSRFSSWLLAIHSSAGVFSEMENYNQSTEIEDAKKVLGFLKEYWKRYALSESEKEEKEADSDMFLAFVLMDDLCRKKKPNIMPRSITCGMEQ